MRIALTVIVSMCVVWYTTGLAAQDISSGPQVGEAFGAFHVFVVSCPETPGLSGKHEDFVGEVYKNDPFILIFARSLSASLGSLLASVDAEVGGERCEPAPVRLRGLLILITEDPDVAKIELKRFGERHGIKSITLSTLDGTSGPRGYKLSRDADVTVAIGRRSLKVTANHAFRRDEIDMVAIDRVISDLKAAPTK